MVSQGFRWGSAGQHLSALAFGVPAKLAGTGWGMAGLAGSLFSSGTLEPLTWGWKFQDGLTHMSEGFDRLVAGGLGFPSGWSPSFSLHGLSFLGGMTFTCGWLPKEQKGKLQSLLRELSEVTWHHLATLGQSKSQSQPRFKERGGGAPWVGEMKAAVSADRLPWAVSSAKMSEPSF